MKKKNIASIYPLSPMQQGMLFHTLYEPQAGMYFEHFTCSITGALDVEAFKAAWAQVAERHPILRTAFIWEGQPQPLQVVFRDVALAWTELDWRAWGPDEQAVQLAAFLRADRSRGFDLTRPPLMRLALLRCGAEHYRLVWAHHHLLMDGWSLPIVLREVFTLYADLHAQRVPSLPAARPYEDYIAWLQKQDLGAAERFWRTTLAGWQASASLTQRIGHSPESALAQYAEARRTLPAQLLNALESYIRAQRLTLNTLMQGVWAMLLQCYIGTDDVVFGGTVSGRPADLPGVEGIVGLFINTLPLRVTVARDMPVRAWLEEIQARQLALQQYEYTPLAQIQQWAGAGRASALFESLLVVENYPLEAQMQEAAPGLSISAPATSERTNYPLTVIVYPRLEETLSLVLSYDVRQFDAPMIERILDHMGAMLESIVAQPEAYVRNLSLLTLAERDQLLHTWNDTERIFPAERLVHEWVTFHATETPTALAALAPEGALTYADLERRANQLGHYLRRLGVAPETHVAVYCNRTLDGLVGMLAVLKLGGAYLPIDPAYPAERVKYMLDDAHVRVVLTHSALAEGVASADWTVVCLDKPSAEVRAESEALCFSATLPNQAAYLIYTSGSTGQPKGVVVEHQSLLNLVHWHQHTFGVTARDRGTHLAGPAFDASVWEIWPYLAAGATLCWPTEAVRLSAHPLRDWLVEQGVTVCFLPTALAELMLDLPWPNSAALRVLLTGGDYLHRRPPAGLPFTFVNNYGPTEYTVVTTSGVVWPGTPGAPSIGRPITNTALYLLDENLQPVPIGVPGQIYISGAGLARGYWQRPALTAERFIPNPFSHTPGMRLYCTGDSARHRADGTIDFLGRGDHQVKLRGFRIELGEIEEALGRHPAIQSAVVVLREVRPGERGLVAYFVPARRPAPSLRDLRRFLKEWLPEYMIPGTFIVLEALPLTPNGKVDRAALPAVERTAGAPGATPVAPRTPLEAQLVELWQQVLRVARVGIHQNFFELGGDSILSIQLVARGVDAGLQFTIKQLFQYPTVAELAQVVAAQPARAAVEQSMAPGPVPLAPIQSWFFELELPQPEMFVQAVALDARERLDPSLLEQALSWVWQHHATLRLRYTRTGTPPTWHQTLPERGTAPRLRVVDLVDLPEEQIQTTIATVTTQAFDAIQLSTGRLQEALWFEFGPKRMGRMIWIMHHLVVDGVSWRILLEDLQTAYAQLRRGEPVRLPAPTTSYRVWQERLQAWLLEAEGQRALQYWLQNGTQSVKALPGDHAEGWAGNLWEHTQTLEVFLTPEETAALIHEASRAYHTTVEDLLLVALGCALQRWSGLMEFVLDLENHGREALFDELDLTRTVGWFTAMYPVRLKLESTELRVLIPAVKEQLRAVPQRGLGYGVARYAHPDEAVRAQLRSARRPAVAFNYLGQFDQSAHNDASVFTFAPEADAVRVPLRGPRPHLLEIGGGVAQGRLGLRWDYAPSAYSAADMANLAENFLKDVRAVLDHCLAREVGSFTPSDFPAARVAQSDLDILLRLAGQEGA